MVIPMVNHLEGKTGGAVELLEQLTDQQLTEQLEYYRQQRDATDKAYDAWRWSRNISVADRVLAKRTHV
jgi:hypothetical protein